MGRNNWFSNLLPAITNAINSVANNPSVQQINNSPAGQMLQGNYQNVLPRIQEMATKGTIAGKPYNPQFQWAGEAGGGDFAKPGLPKIDQPTEMGSYNFSDRNPLTNESPKNVKAGTGIKYTKPSMAKNPNPQPASMAQGGDTPGSGFTPEELAQQRNELKTQTPKTPQIVDRSSPERTHSTDLNAIKENNIAAQKRNIQIDGKYIKTPNDAAQVNATLNGYGIKGSLTQQLQQSQDKIGALSKQAQAIVKNQGGTISKDQLVTNMSHEINQTEGHGLDPQSTPYQVGSYIDRVYARATGQDPTTTFAPPDIPGDVVQKMKTFMNADSQTTWGKDPTSWTPGQIVARNSRDAFDNVLDHYYPNASKLNNDMSDLYKSYDSLKTGANQEGATIQKAANQPQPNIIQRGMNAMKNNPVGYGALALAGAGTLPSITNAAIGAGTLAAEGIKTELPRIQNALGDLAGIPASNSKSKQNTNTQPHNGTTIAPPAPNVNNLPQGADDIQIGQDGSANLTNPFTSGLAIDKNTYLKQQADLNKQIKTLEDSQQIPANQIFPKSQAIAGQIKGLQAQLGSLEAQNSTSRSIDAPYSDAQNIVSGTKTTLKDLNKSGSNLFESNGTINDTVFRTDKDYSNLVSSIDYLQKSSGFQVYTPGISSEALKSNILQAEKILLYKKYYSTLSGGYAGGSQGSSAIPPGPATTTTQPSGQLPPITSPDSGGSVQGTPHPFVY